MLCVACKRLKPSRPPCRYHQLTGRAFLWCAFSIMQIIRRHSLDALVFLLLFWSFAYFQHSLPGWNVNSRFALTLALAESGTAQVDRYVSQPALETQDLAAFDGHLYSDKSIGTSVLGVPAAWVVGAVETAADRTFSTATRRYLVTLLSVGVAGALSGVLLMRFLSLLWSPVPGDRSLETAPGSARPPSVTGDAAFAAIGVTLGSMLFLHGTLFMSYLPAHMFLVASLLMLEKALRRVRRAESLSGAHVKETGWPLPVILHFALAGLFAGLSALCEYTYAVAPAFMGVYLLARLIGRVRVRDGGFHLFRRLGESSLPGAVYIVGGVIGFAPFLAYTYSIFGRFAIPYEYHLMPEFRAAMAQGLMGASWPPDGDVLWLITFHPFRGIFFYSPLLLLGAGGILWMIFLDKPRRAFAWLSVACIGFYLLFNSAYYMWWGGWSFAPRHLAPAIPFMAAGLFPWFGSRWRWWVAVVAALFGVGVHTLVNATEPQTPDGGWQTALLRPDLVAFDYPAIFLHDTWPRVLDGAFDANLGNLAGLPGNLWSLVPLFAWWIIMTWLIRVRLKKLR